VKRRRFTDRLALPTARIWLFVVAVVLLEVLR